jgi:hypothetical protein
MICNKHKIECHWADVCRKCVEEYLIKMKSNMPIYKSKQMKIIIKRDKTKPRNRNFFERNKKIC